MHIALQERIGVAHFRFLVYCRGVLGTKVLADDRCVVGAVAEVSVIAYVDAGRYLVVLHNAVDRGIAVIRTCTKLQSGHLAVGAGLSFGDDVENAANALGVVFGTRVHNHLNALYGRSRQRFQYC